jgi:BolA family transcriptional regulator, general stress-responsive regulator
MTAKPPATGESRLQRIRSQLALTLPGAVVELIDDSHRHAGHAGARDGRGHFRLRIVSEAFVGLRPLQRHQLVYRSLGELMQTDIHALGITALAPDEVAHEEVGSAGR